MLNDIITYLYIDAEDGRVNFVLTGLILYLVIGAIINIILFYKEGWSEVLDRTLNTSLVIILTWLFWSHQKRFISMDLLFIDKTASGLIPDLIRNWLFYTVIVVGAFLLSYRTKGMNLMNFVYVLIFYYILSEAYVSDPQNPVNENVLSFLFYAIPFYLYFNIGAFFGKSLASD